MRKILLLSSALLTLTACNVETEELSSNGPTTISGNVYICGTEGSGRYHYDKHCQGLNACNHGVNSVSLQEAKDLGNSLCHWEN